MDQRTDGSRATTESLGDVGFAQVVVEAQNEGRLLAIRQAEQRVADLVRLQFNDRDPLGLMLTFPPTLTVMRVARIHDRPTQVRPWLLDPVPASMELHE